MAVLALVALSVSVPLLLHRKRLVEERRRTSRLSILGDDDGELVFLNVIALKEKHPSHTSTYELVRARGR
jgi:hypothetical protein